jgi:DNA-binding MarR family transcriptional regulator
MTPDRPDPQVFRLFNEVEIIEQLACNWAERRLAHGLRLSQFTALNYFVRLDGQCSPARLTKAFQVTKGAMTNTVQRLEALGFVEVVPDPADGRGKLVRITDAGGAAHTDSLARLEPDLGAIQAVFGAQAFEAAVPFLGRLRAYLDQNRG